MGLLDFLGKGHSEGLTVDETLVAMSKGAVLIDVRTKPEWQFVGIPDLSGIGKRVAPVSWRAVPASS